MIKNFEDNKKYVVLKDNWVLNLSKGNIIKCVRSLSSVTLSSLGFCAISYTLEKEREIKNLLIQESDLSCFEKISADFIQEEFDI